MLTGLTRRGDQVSMLTRLYTHTHTQTPEED